MTTVPQESRKERIAAAPSELRTHAQWVLWCAVASDRPNTKPAKVPYTPGLTKADITRKRDYSTYADVLQAYEARPDYFSGIGFCLTTDDPFTGIDFDHCFDASGQLDPWVQTWVDRLASYTEVSPSGNGIRIFVRGTRSAAIKTKRAEIYSTKRFLTVTGKHLAGSATAVRDAQTELDALALELRPTASATPTADTTLPINEDAVQRTLSTIKRLLDSQGIPRRLTDKSQGRAILREALAGWPGGIPDYSNQRSFLVNSLVLHGYPDAEIAALLWHYRPVLNGGGKNVHNWNADIARMIGKYRAKRPNIQINPSGTAHGTQAAADKVQQAPLPPTRPQPTKRNPGRPGMGADAYFAWLSAQLDVGDCVMLSVAECAKRLSVSKQTIHRYERVLKAQDRIERRVFAQRQAGCVFVKQADSRGNNITASVYDHSLLDVVTGDRELVHSNAENGEAGVIGETHLLFAPAAPTAQPLTEHKLCSPKPAQPLADRVYSVIRAIEADERVSPRTGEIRPGIVRFKRVAMLVREQIAVSDRLLREVFDRQMIRRKAEREIEKLRHMLPKRLHTMGKLIDRILITGKADPRYWWAWFLYDHVSTELDRRASLKKALKRPATQYDKPGGEQLAAWEALELDRKQHVGPRHIPQPIRVDMPKPSAPEPTYEYAPGFRWEMIERFRVRNEQQTIGATG